MFQSFSFIHTVYWLADYKGRIKTDKNNDGDNSENLDTRNHDAWLSKQKTSHWRFVKKSYTENGFLKKEVKVQ